MDQIRGTSPVRSSSSASLFQGVLWKRRDVFKSRWRPRWFVLQPASGLLTYYVDDGTRTEDGVVQYDVVPRGTIYLRSCHVEIDDLLSRPSENLYAFSITPPTTSEGPPCFLAATTREERSDWVERLSRVCRVEDQDDGTSQSVASAPSVTDDPSAANVNEERSTESWEDIDDGKDTLVHVPEQLASHIQNLVQKNLPMMGENKKEHGWKLIFQNRNGVTAHERKLDASSGRVMIKCTALIHHHPKQILNLLVDASRRQDFEANIVQNERLKCYNSHTFLDYYSFRPVWPTAARDLVTAVHWRVLQKKSSTVIAETGGDFESPGNKAICIMGFSWSDAETDRLKPVDPDKVRANLLVSLYLLEEIKERDNIPKCRVTRVLSYDLCGNLPPSLSNTVLHQQATMPSIVDTYLNQTEPAPATRLSGELSNTGVIKGVIEPLASTSQRRDSFLNQQKSGESRVVDVAGLPKPQEVSSSSSSSSSDGEPPLFWVTSWLLSPLVIWTLACLLSIPFKESLFLVSAWVSLRTVVLAHAGRPYTKDTFTGSSVKDVTFRFSIDLKGVLRYIANNKKEHEGEATNADTPEVSVVPIVVKAMAQAMSQVEDLSCKHVYQPLLGIDGLFQHSKPRNVDVSVLSARHSTASASDTTAATDSLVTIRNASSKTIEDIAKDITAAEKEQMISEERMGNCLVILAAPDSDPCDVDMNVSMSTTHHDLVDVVLVVGGVSLSREQTNGRSPRGHHAKKPMLSMSMTIHSPVSSVATCRAFSDQVQKLLNFPEFCDE